MSSKFLRGNIDSSLSQVLEVAGPHLAAATLPAGLVSQQPAARQDEGESGDAADGVEGVWAAELVPRRTLFGPYEGDAIALNKKVRGRPHNSAILLAA